MCGWHPRRVSLIEARSVLVIRPDEIGDVILTSPFLRELRHAAPQAKITLLVKSACYELVQHCPYVDSVQTLNFAPHWDKPGVLRLCRQTLSLRWSTIGWGGFDLILLPRRDADWYGSVLAGHLLAGRGVIKVHRDQVVNNLAPLPPPPPVKVFPVSNPNIEHEVLQSLHFLSACGAEVPVDSHLEIWLTDSDRAFARDWLARTLPRGAPLVVLHPSGGRSRLKQWPKENFRVLLDRLLAETSCDFLIVGGADEQWILEEFINTGSDRVAKAVGGLTLRQLAAVLEKASLFIGGDSGPMHLAAAAGTRVLAIFGPTSEIRFSPLGANCRVISLHYECSPDRLGTYKDRCETCRFSEPRCLIELPVGTVFDEVRNLLEQYSAIQGVSRTN